MAGILQEAPAGILDALSVNLDGEAAEGADYVLILTSLTPARLSSFDSARVFHYEKSDPPIGRCNHSNQSGPFSRCDYEES